MGRAFIEVWVEVLQKEHREKHVWIKQLREQNIKGAHPDDGWVDRENNILSPCYPQFWDRPIYGDRIALGTPQKFRIVRILGKWSLLLMSDPYPYKYKFFEEDNGG